MFKRLALVLTVALALTPVSKTRADDIGNLIVMISLGAGLLPVYQLWSQRDDSWVYLPVNKPGYRPAFSMAMMGGDMHADELGGRDRATGFEFAFNSMLLQPLKQDRIRQQVSHVTYNSEGSRIASLEANAHYMVAASPEWEIGFGPGIGFVEVGKINSKRVNAVQLGLSALYHYEDYYIGAELRHQFAESLEVNGTRVDPDNTRLMIKLGFWL